MSNLLSQLTNLTIWKKGSQRAPHKPLLILLAISELVNHQRRFLPYSEIRDRMIQLLQTYGPARKSYKPEEPFSRLPKDGIWQLRNASYFSKSGNISNGNLIKFNIEGGFTDEVWKELSTNSDTLSAVVALLLEEHFPVSYHEDLLRELSLDDISNLLYESAFSQSKSRKRDPNFRHKILQAYNFECAICGYNLRITNTPVGLEAAHIKWHQAGGVDSEENGLALCATHHKLFDYGAMGVSPTMEIIVSDRLNGNRDTLSFHASRFHGQKLVLPQRESFYPETTNIVWHAREVYKG